MERGDATQHCWSSVAWRITTNYYYNDETTCNKSQALSVTLSSNYTGVNARTRIASILRVVVVLYLCIVVCFCQ